MSHLTEAQKQAADNLRAIRPTCIPGTNVIPSTTKREQFYSLVMSALSWNGIDDADALMEFCDRAGIPD
jgi:hypothetical protein